MNYTANLTNYHRLNTYLVNISGLMLGGTAPIRLQTMTNTRTSNVNETIAQSILCIEAGAELIRITCPSVKDVAYLAAIKKALQLKGYNTPIVADIHFSPQAAIEAAKVVDKVRINPGNYTDKKRIGQVEFTQEEYSRETEKIEQNLGPLLEVCKKYNTAIRIGVNHGSLSDRIMSRYGDTPEGMAESAMEFLRICHQQAFQNVVISMKASNTIVMVQATRLLAAYMLKENMNYPLHIGVTESGDGEEGRIKSAVGIGTLLIDGLGDTIRVSLTEDPEKELPVAQALVQFAEGLSQHKKVDEIINYQINPFRFKRQNTHPIENIGNRQVPVVISDLSGQETIDLSSIGWNYSAKNQQWKYNDLAADAVFLNKIPTNLPTDKLVLIPFTVWSATATNKNVVPVCDSSEILDATLPADQVCALKIGINNINTPGLLNLLTQKPNTIIILRSDNANVTGEFRYLYNQLIANNITNPVILKYKYSCDKEMFQLNAAAQSGAMFIDGMGDGLWLSNTSLKTETILRTSFIILQACRARIYKTEYISCPGCGRTLFDLQKTTQKIKQRTAHLKGVKIGVMGCIVNGPGEMADADYGYVGSGPGKISLYKNKEVVKRNISEANAVDELIKLIKEHGDWQ